MAAAEVRVSYSRSHPEGALSYSALYHTFTGDEDSKEVYTYIGLLSQGNGEGVDPPIKSNSCVRNNRRYSSFRNMRRGGKVRNSPESLTTQSVAVEVP